MSAHVERLAQWQLGDVRIVVEWTPNQSEPSIVDADLEALDDLKLSVTRSLVLAAREQIQADTFRRSVARGRAS